VDRQVVDTIVDNQAELMEHVRIMPVRDNGDVVGIRVLGVRPDTLLGLLGVEDGDRLESVNGLSTTSPEQLLEAYALVRRADRLVARIDRRGQKLDLVYALR
jgi:general secretion pathway protein C